MEKRRPRLLRLVMVATLFGLSMIAPRIAHAHCDTLGGPVVADAKMAFEKGEITPVLKWVKPADEGEIRAAFEKTMAVRKLSPEAKELADNSFFETLVRIHRAGEGAPYTGLKPAAAVDPAVELADKALESGSPDELVKALTGHVAEGIRVRFKKVAEAKKHANESVEKGREYVEAYVDYTHYAENLHRLALGHGGHHAEAEAEAAPAARSEHKH